MYLQHLMYIFYINCLNIVLNYLFQENDLHAHDL